MRNNRFQNFMSGRYGSDQLNQLIWIVTLILVVVNIFTRFSILWFIAVVLLVVAYWRMFSRNTTQRALENDRFMGFISRFRRGGRGYGGRGYGRNNGYGGSGSYGGSGGYGGRGGQNASSRRAEAERKRAQREDQKYYKYFNCPNCNQKVRVPKGKGKIEITCPKCRTSFIRKT